MTRKMAGERFIAGAVCPACQALDRLVVATSEDGTERQRCVSCGFVKTGAPIASTPPGSRLQRRQKASSVTVRIIPVQHEPDDREGPKGG